MMKKNRSNLSVAFALAALGLLWAASTEAAITGSLHDFSSAAWNTTKELCAVCHTPHYAVTASAPLWNHVLTKQTYSLYSSPTLKAADIGQPSGSSIACLSCHDGTVAVDSYGGTHSLPGGGDQGTQTIDKFPKGTDYLVTSNGVVKNDLTRSHPISFTYDPNLVKLNPGLFDPTSKPSGAIGKSGTIDSDMLFNHKIECSTCHDPHNVGGPGVEHFLRKSNAGSALCLTCHNK